MNEPVYTSSGNVFDDLGFNAEEGALLTMRADLVAHLRETIDARGWSQAQAGALLGLGQSQVADLMRGKRDKFTFDTLVTLATRVGFRVTLTMAS